MELAAGRRPPGQPGAELVFGVRRQHVHGDRVDAVVALRTRAIGVARAEGEHRVHVVDEAGAEVVLILPVEARAAAGAERVVDGVEQGVQHAVAGGRHVAEVDALIVEGHGEIGGGRKRQAERIVLGHIERAVGEQAGVLLELVHVHAARPRGTEAQAGRNLTEPANAHAEARRPVPPAIADVRRVLGERRETLEAVRLEALEDQQRRDADGVSRQHFIRHAGRGDELHDIDAELVAAEQEVRGLVAADGGREVRARHAIVAAIFGIQAAVAVDRQAPGQAVADAPADGALRQHEDVFRARRAEVVDRVRPRALDAPVGHEELAADVDAVAGGKPFRRVGRTRERVFGIGGGCAGHMPRHRAVAERKITTGRECRP